MPEPEELNEELQGRKILSVEPGTTPGWMLINLELKQEERESQPGLRLFLTVFIGGRKGSDEDNYYSTSALHFQRAGGFSNSYTVRDGRDREMRMSSAHTGLGDPRLGAEGNLKTTPQNEARDNETLPDPPRCEIRADAVSGSDETENFNTDGRHATKILTFRGDGRRWHRLWVCDQCLSDGSFKREIPVVPGQEVQVFVFDRTIE